MTVVRTAGEKMRSVERLVDSVLPMDVVKKVSTGFVWQSDMAATVVVACREAYEVALLAVLGNYSCLVND